MSGSADLELVKRAVDRLLTEHPPPTSTPTEFLGARYDAGLAWVHFEPGFGGLGLPSTLQPMVTEMLDAAGSPRPTANFVGVHQGAAAIHAFASDELKRRWLRPAFTNEEFWCQLFSEPGAGSDLAGLSTAAVRDGDSWVVNGQKVWTSFAHRARWGILLARTDPDAPKHRGLTFFVVDMNAGGVDVRPLRTMDGARHFNEVFLTDVDVPDRYRLGDVGQGWGVSMHLLGAEREGVSGNESPLSWLLEVWEQRAPSLTDDGVTRDRVAATYVVDEVSRLLALRAKGAQEQVGGDGIAPLVKLSRNLADQQTGNLVVDLLGPDGALGGEYDWEERGDAPNDQMRFLWTREATIGGGTVQILRNVIGERLLGLPGDVRVDKDIPWKQIPRS
jgi:alkylation response protein AidB-like acyl-CoA dehydrogenase